MFAVATIIDILLRAAPLEMPVWFLLLICGACCLFIGTLVGRWLVYFQTPRISRHMHAGLFLPVLYVGITLATLAIAQALIVGKMFLLAFGAL